MTGALYSAISGLQSHMSKLNVIGNNIANVNTHSYKTTRMTFTESIYSTARAGQDSAGLTTGGVNPTQYGYGSKVSSVDVNMAAGTYSPTGYALDCMITGDGFFLVGDKNGTFSTVGDISSLALTRMGDFRPDSDGYITDAAGNIVYGFAMVQNPAYNPNATEAEILEDPTIIEPTILSTDLVPLQYPLAAATPTYENGGLTLYYSISEGDYWGGTAVGEDEGGLMYFDPAGTYSFTVNRDADGEELGVDDDGYAEYTGYSAFIKMVEHSGFTSTSDYLQGVADAQVSELTYVESENWKESSAVYSYLSEPDVLNGNASFNQTAEVYYDENGDLVNEWGGPDIGETYPLGYNTSQMVANTSAYSVQLSSVSISSSGMISGINSVTGEPVVVGYIAVATVDNTSGVTNTGGHYYSALGGSGNLRVSIAGGLADGLYLANKTGTVDEETGEVTYEGISDLDAIGNAGGSSIEAYGLEASTVDLATEMSEMIITQRGYQANTRIVTVTDSMLEELVNLKR
ncbi:MAG: flagellar hook-basal body complex protein [Eubacteriales bacterium]